MHKETVNQLRQRQYYLTKENKEMTKKLNSTNLSNFVNEYLKGMQFENHATLVLDLVYSGEMFGDAGKKGWYGVCSAINQVSDHSVEIVQN